jgi:hypothetical protein
LKKKVSKTLPDDFIFFDGFEPISFQI